MEVKITETLVQALLSEAKGKGIDGLTLTTLVKLIYLADVYYARQHEGKTYTGIKWKFHHFGPYEYNISESLKDNKFSLVSSVKGETRDEGNEFFLLKLTESGNPAILDNTDLGISAKTLLSRDISKFSFDLKKLLDYVYFETEPMEGAIPGHELSFNSCYARKPSDFKALGEKKIPKDKLSKGRELLSILKNKRSDKHRLLKDFSPPIYDDHYESTRDENTNDDHTPSFHTAKLTFDR